MYIFAIIPMVGETLMINKMNKEEWKKDWREAYNDLENILIERNEELECIEDDIKTQCLKFLLESRISKRDKDIFKEIFKKYLP